MTSTTDIPIEVGDDIDADFRAMFTQGQSETARMRAAFEVLEAERVEHHPVSCKWPMMRTYWTGSDRITSCGRGVHKGDETYGPAFCWQHNDLMLRHVASLVDSSLDVSVQALEHFGRVILTKLRDRANEDAGKHIYNEWGDWVDEEISRRLRKQDISPRLRRELNDYIEEALAEKWSLS